MTECEHPLSRVFSYDDRETTEDFLYGKVPVRMHCYVCGNDLSPIEVDATQAELARLLGKAPTWTN